MRKKILLFLLIGHALSGISQSDTVKYIFMGHTRDDDREHEYVLRTIKNIDYSKFDLTLLGGDLTWNTSADRSTLEYCDSIFHLGYINTHLAAGNHDLDNLADLLEFTGKPRYYAFSKNNITFLVLDTEVSIPDFKDEQLSLIQQVADTIENSDYLVLIHHRIIWMAGVPELAYLMDSVAASTKNLSHSDFYTDVYPLLQKVKDKGIEILCLAGDRTDVNIRYNPEDSITFLASGMRGTAADDENFAIILTHIIDSGKLEWKFTALSDIDTVNRGPVQTILKANGLSRNICVYPVPSAGIIRINFEKPEDKYLHMEIYNLQGSKITDRSIHIRQGQLVLDISDFMPGTYLVRFSNGHEVFTGKIIIVK